MKAPRGIATDEDLLAATPGRPDAFAAFYRRHLGSLLALLLHRTRRREATADLAAEVFASALEQTDGALALVDGVPLVHRDAVVQGVLDRELAVGELRRSNAVVRGAARPEQSFFEMLEADLVQAATALSGSEALAFAPPARRRLRWRP